MNPSAYDPDMIQTAISKLELVRSDLLAEGTLTVRNFQQALKWGDQLEPVRFKKLYTETLADLHTKLSKALDEVTTLQDSLAHIKRDVSDADASSAAIANQINANRKAADSGSSIIPSSTQDSY